MKLHEIKTQISSISGLPAFDGEGCIEVFVTGDTPEAVPVVRKKLEAAGVIFLQSKPRKFKGATFTIPIKNVGTAFHANWEYVTEDRS